MKHVFEALPHVNEIWVTKDGHFHLHPHNGGDRITRKEALTEKKKETPKEPVEEIIDNGNKEPNEEVINEDSTPKEPVEEKKKGRKPSKPKE